MKKKFLLKSGKIIVDWKNVARIANVSRKMLDSCRKMEEWPRLYCRMSFFFMFFFNDSLYLLFLMKELSFKFYYVRILKYLFNHLFSFTCIYLHIFAML